jgi:hypothetical protein
MSSGASTGGGFNSSGKQALDEQIARIRSLPGLAERAAPAIARATQNELARTIAAGTTPDGVPWKKTQAGERPLQNAAREVRVSAQGSVVVTSIEGHLALHHLGRAKGGVRRQVIPTKAIPDPVTRAIETALTGEFRATMGGAR